MDIYDYIENELCSDGEEITPGLGFMEPPEPPHSRVILFLHSKTTLSEMEDLLLVCDMQNALDFLLLKQKMYPKLN